MKAMSVRGLAVVLATAAVSFGYISPGAPAAAAASLAAVSDTPATSAAPAALTTDEKAFYRDMARSSWTYMNAYYQRATGLVNATSEWANTTLWDVGSQLLAFHAAKELGFLSPADFDGRMTKAFATLEKAPLYQKTAFNKLYSTTTGRRGEGGSVGWSATDLGRFLLALKIIALREPAYAAQAERIVRRNNFAKIVKDGYLHGLEIKSNGKTWIYQEGRIGYEQYVATGFSQWGADVGNALNVAKNGDSVRVLGVPLLQDRRYQDRLLSEPFVLYGIELGLSGGMKDLAVNLLKAQEERFKATGKITIVSEDAVSVPPEYFYYYCVYCNRKPFVIDINVAGKERDTPRWVSTKATFGWNALMPSDYTKKAAAYVAAAKDPRRGWASGVMEDTGVSTKTYDINTAAVLMEIAFYKLRGSKPLIQPGPVLPD